jgi:TolB protein
MIKDCKAKPLLLPIHLLALTPLTLSTSVDLVPHTELAAGNGKILFLSSRDANHEQIHVMNADGTGERALTNDGYEHFYPSWSPDGSQILFQRTKAEPFGRFRPADYTPGPYDHLGRGIFVMNEDGSGKRKLTDLPANDPVWSPDGMHVAFSRGQDVFVMNADGTGERRLTDGPASDGNPTWSPDGTQIAFVRGSGYVQDIYAVRSDGTNLMPLTKKPREYVEILWLGIEWSPVGSEIAFVAAPNVLDADIYVVSADGSGQRRLTERQAPVGDLEWAPDGSGIAFSAAGGLLFIGADGNDLRTVAASSAGAFPFSWSPDGSQIVFANSSGIIVANADGSAERVLTPERGRWLDWQPLPELKDERAASNSSYLIWIAGAAVGAAALLVLLVYPRLRGRAR